MMRVTVALCGLVAVAAGNSQQPTNSCPPNSKQIAPYKDMSSCECNPGWRAYPAPGWGCYKPQAFWECPAHSTPRTSNPASMSDCKCAEGWAPYESTCVYAYLFHVHGRMWLQPFDETKFGLAQEQAFQRAMGAALNISAADILPYSIHNVKNITTDIYDARLDHAKILLAENEVGQLRSSESTVSIGFAVRLRSSSMAKGNELVDELKQFSTLQNLETRLDFQDAAFGETVSAKLFIWALTAQFWRPRATKTLGEPCVYPHECKTGTTCQYNRAKDAHVCSEPFKWAKKEQGPAPTAPPTARPPQTPVPTLPPALFGKAQRAAVAFDVSIKCLCPDTQALHQCLQQSGALSYQEFDAQKRADFIINAAHSLNVPPKLVYVNYIVPAKANPATFDPNGFSPYFVQKEGVVVNIGVNTYSVEQTNALLLSIRHSSLAADLNVLSQCVTVKEETASVTPKAPVTPTQMPTQAPTVSTKMPGSTPICASGATIEVEGTARFIARASLDDPMTFMNKAGKGVRQCMAQPFSSSGVTWCHVKVTMWNESSYYHAPYGNKWLLETGLHTKKNLRASDFDRRLSEQMIHKQLFDNETDGAHYLAPDTEHIWAYTFAFQLDVPTADMHAGNDVFDYINSHTREYMKQINNCTGAGYYVPPQLSKGEKYLPNHPSFETVNVSSVYYTFVEKQVTHAPTMSPTTQKRDCMVSQWSIWTRCSKTCATGTKSRFRLVVEDEFGGGRKCPNLAETQTCIQAQCPVDCQVGEWGAFGQCSKTCGNGEMIRRRQITTESAYGGLRCPNLNQTKSCGSLICPVNCKTSEWGNWGDCSKQCNGGRMKRYRTIENTQYYGGKACGPLSDESDCNDQPCPVNCVVSPWSSWGSCSKTCAGQAPGTRLFGAKQERTRYEVVPEQHGGQECPRLTQTKLCALHPCGAHVCTTDHGFPLTCTYERGIVYTHHVNDVHDNELFMCYHNYVTEVCTCLCWPKTQAATASSSGAASVDTFNPPEV